MSEDEDTPTPLPENPKKRGRKPGSKIFRPSDASTKRNYSASVSTVYRERIHPDVLFEFLEAILGDKNPKIEKDGKGGHRVVESINGPTPTMQQKMDAYRELTNRRDGMVPQSIQIDAMLRATVAPELPPALLNQFSPQALWHLQQALGSLGPGSDPNAEAIDAEFVDKPSSDAPDLQETGQLVTDLQELDQTQEPDKAE